MQDLSTYLRCGWMINGLPVRKLKVDLIWTEMSSQFVWNVVSPMLIKNFMDRAGNNNVRVLEIMNKDQEILTTINKGNQLILSIFLQSSSTKGNHSPTFIEKYDTYKKKVIYIVSESLLLF